MAHDETQTEVDEDYVDEDYAGESVAVQLFLLCNEMDNSGASLDQIIYGLTKVSGATIALAPRSNREALLELFRVMTERFAKKFDEALDADNAASKEPTESLL